MILFFHVICLFVRYFVCNISKKLTEPKVLSEENISKIISSAENYCKRKIEYTKYPVYEDAILKFIPPVFVQRYETVAFTLQDPELGFDIHKVVDFGCAELGFFAYLKTIESLTEILEVDIDTNILERNSFKAAPLTSDYLMGKREKPLNVYVLAGSVVDFDDCLLNCDAVVAIELIEHLNEEDLEKMPYNIFYKIKPKIAIFTTPNADFNSLLPNFSNMRHKDHKFEWSRKEFYVWTSKILHKYPEYCVKFFGIGAGPEGTENLGCCSQMAVFYRVEDTDPFVSSRDKHESIQNYKLIKHYEFPAYVDNRTTEEKIVDEIQYRTAYLRRMDLYYNFETNKSEIPLNILKEYLTSFQIQDDELMEIITNSGMTVTKRDNEWFLIHSDTESNSSDLNFSENELNEFIPINDSFEEAWTDEEQEEDHDSNHCKPLVSEESNNLLYAGDCLRNSNSLVVKNNTKENIFKSRISCTEAELTFMRKSIFQVCKFSKKIFRSSSLDSCLENINHKSSEQNSYLSSASVSSSPFHRFSPLCRRNLRVNYSDSLLFNSSFDKASDSGYPISPPDEDFTYEQIDELSTENKISRLTTPFCEINSVEFPVHHEVFIENGDVANNNQDREGNIVEGLLGERVVDEVAVERDSNDNYFFPDIGDFPLWLLNLGELALLPVYIPLYEDGVADEDLDSSTDYNRSLDLEDLDIDF